MITAVSDLLSCAVCFRDLTATDAIVRCDRGHSFDIARSGFVTLFSPPGRKPPIGDTAAMVDARLAVLEAGHYGPLQEALVREIVAVKPCDVIADLGSGPGFYAKTILDAVPGVGRIVACDSSLAAMKRAGRIHPRLGAVRSDIRTRLPLRDGSVDVALVVFAPRNVSEWVRILKADGRVVIAVPNPDHLHELRDAGRVLGIEDDKISNLVRSVAPSFSVERTGSVTWSMDADPRLIESVIAMGPSAYHPHDRHGEVAFNGLTGSVSIIVLRKA